MVSSKKTAECQYRRNNPEGLSLGHRRLRFSFQINDFKDQGAGDRLQPFSARLRRRRRCSRLGSLCQEVLLEELPGPFRPGGRRRRRLRPLRFPRQAVLF